MARFRLATCYDAFPGSARPTVACAPFRLSSGRSCTVLSALKLTRCASTEFYDNRCLPKRVLMAVLRVQLLAPSWYSLDAAASQHNTQPQL